MCSVSSQKLVKLGIKIRDNDKVNTTLGFISWRYLFQNSWNILQNI